ncbi:hypothetical protein PRIPAC_74548, partial [Pristionchus pacificus]|uniref:Uncharacterized protein n=1 Tax=Pristionchus pacificus TaxID=54126 RepID=A0A2A6CFC5_PRIPA
RPAETPLSGAARRLHDDLRDKHNGEIYYDKLIKYYDYHEYSLSMLHAGTSHLRPSARDTIERAVIDPTTALIAGQEPQVIRESIDNAYDSIADNFNEMMNGQDSSRTVVMISAMTGFAVNVNDMRVFAPHLRGSFWKRGHPVDRSKRGGKRMRRSGLETNGMQDGDEAMDGSQSGGEEQNGLKRRKSGRTGRGKEVQAGAGDSEAREDAAVTEEVPELNGQGGVDSMEGGEEMEGEDVKMKKRNTAGKVEDAMVHDGSGDAEAREEEAMEGSEKNGDGEEAANDMSDRRGDTMDAIHGSFDGDREGLESKETKEAEAIRDHPSMDDLKPKGESAEVPAEEREERPSEDREGGEEPTIDGMEKGEEGEEAAKQLDGKVEAREEEKMMEEKENGGKGDEECMVVQEHGGGGEVMEVSPLGEVAGEGEKTVVDVVIDDKKTDIGDEKTNEIREASVLDAVDVEKTADNGDGLETDKHSTTVVFEARKDSMEASEHDGEEEIHGESTLVESNETAEIRAESAIDGGGEGVDTPPASGVKGAEGDAGEAVELSDEVKTLDGKKEDEERSTLESSDRKEEEESAHDSIDRAKKGEAAIPDELEAKPIDASESRDEDNHEAPKTDDCMTGGTRSVIEADDHTVESREREGDALLADPSMDASEKDGTGEGGGGEEEQMEEGEEMEDEDEEEMEDEEELSEITFVGSEEDVGEQDERDHFIYDSNDLPPFLLPFNEHSHDGEEVVLMAEEEEIQTAYFEEEVEVDEENGYCGGRRMEEGDEAMEAGEHSADDSQRIDGGEDEGMEEGEVEIEEEESSDCSAVRTVTYNRMSDSEDSSDGDHSPPRRAPVLAVARGPPAAMMDRVHSQGQQGGPATTSASTQQMRRH